MLMACRLRDESSRGDAETLQSTNWDAVVAVVVDDYDVVDTSVQVGIDRLIDLSVDVVG